MCVFLIVSVVIFGILQLTQDNIDEVFNLLSSVIKSGDVMERLETRVKEEGFNRLN